MLGPSDRHPLTAVRTAIVRARKKCEEASRGGGMALAAHLWVTGDIYEPLHPRAETRQHKPRLPDPTVPQ
jgi:hypothetical protein